jgi:hypothetical protein
VLQIPETNAPRPDTSWTGIPASGLRWAV